MRYSALKVSRMFLNWPDLKDTSNLVMVEERVDLIRAVARKEGMTYEQAAHSLDQAWDAVNRLGTLALVTAASAFGKAFVGEINGR